MKRLNRARSRARLVLALSVALALTGILPVSAFARSVSPPQSSTLTIYVNAVAPAGGDGTSWATAFNLLDDAIAAATAAGAPYGHRIFAAEGTYKPGNVTTGFNITVTMKLYGAFLGTESTVEGRLGHAAQTILEGEITPGTFAEHVVSVSSGSPGVMMDGFQIQHGDAFSASSEGGGIRCLNSDLDLVDCILFDNKAYYGGGLYFDGDTGDSGSHKVLHIKQSEFRNNFVDYFGGGLFGENLKESHVVSTKFLSNEAMEQGGGVFLWKQGPNTETQVNQLIFTNCEFWRNWVEVSGGTPGHLGGAVKLDEASPTAAAAANAKFVNCTFSDNYTNEQVDGQALFISPNSLAEVYNSIFAFNNHGVALLKPIFGPATVEYTDTYWGNGSAPWNPGNGNRAVDPLFRNHLLGFLTLIAKPSGVPGSSLCIDASDYGRLGTDVLDLDKDGDTGEKVPIDLLKVSRFVDRWETDTGAPPGSAFLDMGAYEHP